MGDILVQDGTPVVWADATDYVSTVSGFTRTSGADLDLTSLANNAARQGVKASFGASRARQFAVRCGVELSGSPTAGNVVRYFWSASNSATAGTGNDGDCSGTDSAYKAGDEIEWCENGLWFIGALRITADGAGVTQIRTINPRFWIPQRYGQPVVLNEAGVPFDSDAINHFVAFVPVKDNAA